MWRDDERRALHAVDDVGHGEGLAAAGDAEERLVLIAAAQAVDQLVDGLGLVAGGLEVGDEFELGHGSIKCTMERRFL